MKQKNVIFIMTDQHRSISTGCYGKTDARTPNIDALAQESVLFENTYCQYPICVSSRQSIITGQYPGNHGTYNNIRQSINPYQWTMQGAFARAGYETSLIGKSHCNENGFTVNMEWDKYYQHHWPKEVQEQIKPPHFGLKYYDNMKTAGVWPYDEKYTQSDYVMRTAIDYLKRKREQPFFTLISFDYPHPPFLIPRRFWDMFDPDALELPDPDRKRHPHGSYTDDYFTDDMLKNYLHGYYAGLACADWCIGEIMKTVKDEGLLDDSIVIYTSDHGDQCGMHGRYEKHCFYDPSLKVPLLVRTSDTVPGRRSEVVESIDLAPTLTGMCGVDTAGSALDGASLENLLAGNAEGWKNRAYCEHYTVAGTEKDGSAINEAWGRMLVEDGFKITEHGNMYAPHCLYDLTDDPGELTNLWDVPAHAERQKQMLASLYEGWTRVAEPKAYRY